MRINEKIGGGVYMCNMFLNYINAIIKPGSYGGDSPVNRLGGLRHSHTNIEMCYYIPLPKSTKAEYEAVEYHAKMMMLRNFPELTHMGNDHLAFKSTKEEHKTRVKFYCEQYILIVKEYCERYNIAYEEPVFNHGYKKGGVRGKKKS